MADDLYLAEKRAWDARQNGDYAESVRLFEPLAALGSETALLNLGTMYQDGDLGAPDLDKAISLFERAVATGGDSANHYLGWAWKAKGDLQRARIVFLAGAAQGYTPCMYCAGWMLVHGEGGEADIPTGITWLTRGADAGHLFCRKTLVWLEIRRSTSLPRRLFLYSRLVLLALRAFPRLVRDPFAPEFL